ncbi:MAG: hypothetical protein HQ561_08640, partial [Desulfobacteraceae bacterium]|nr:hypothetical protein [Desulfobacteraceae bacterium]
DEFQPQHHAVGFSLTYKTGFSYSPCAKSDFLSLSLSLMIVGGESYGQGSSREHAALCPMYLGVKVVNKTKGITIPVEYNLSDRHRAIILAGGTLNYMGKK